jgi:DNA-binding MarR family transcriptional regulator
LPRWRILLALYDNEHQAGYAGGEQRSEPAGAAGTPPSLSQKRLVERLGVDPGALTRQLKQLEGMGWIARSTDARDNRLTNVALTDEGRGAVEVSLPRRNAFLANALGELPEEALSALNDALKDMEQSLERAGAAASGVAQRDVSGDE